MADDKTRETIKHWLREVVYPRLGSNPGIVKLSAQEGSGSKATVDVFELLIEASDGVGDPRLIEQYTTQIISEAEMVAEGRGGGTNVFTLKACRDKERASFAMRPFTIMMDSLLGSETEDATSRGLIQALMKQNQELHRSVAQMTSIAPKIMQMQLAMAAQRDKLDADNFALLRSNIEQRRLEEAQAEAIVRSSEKWDKMLEMVMPVLMQWGMSALAARSQGDGSNQLPPGDENT